MAKHMVQIGDLKLSKELMEKLLGSAREGLGIGLWIGIRIAGLNQIADLKLSILVPVKFRSLI